MTNHKCTFEIHFFGVFQLCSSKLGSQTARVTLCILYRLFRYFPGRGNIYTNELFIFFTPKMENPGTTRVYCSVHILTVNLQAITTYPPYLTTTRRNDKFTKYFHFFSGWVVWFVSFLYFRSFQIVSFLKYLMCSLLLT